MSWTVIKPAETQDALNVEKPQLEEILSECEAKQTAIKNFIGETKLAGKGWSEAKNHFNYYDVLLFSMKNLCETVNPNNTNLYNTSAGYFGRQYTVSEYSWQVQWNYAYAEWLEAKQELDRIDSSGFALLRTFQRNNALRLCNQWAQACTTARDMIQKIRDYCNVTNGLYPDTDSNSELGKISSILAMGIAAVSGSGLSESGSWGGMDVGWIDELKKAYSSNISGRSEYYSDGQINEDKVRDQFNKPFLIWTDKEKVYMAQAFVQMTEDALSDGGSTEQLNVFLNLLYEQCGEDRDIIHVDLSDIDNVFYKRRTFSLSSSAMDFMLYYAENNNSLLANYDAKANGPVPASWYVTLDMAEGLADYGSTFTVTDTWRKTNPHEIQPNVSVTLDGSKKCFDTYGHPITINNIGEVIYGTSDPREGDSGAGGFHFLYGDEPVTDKLVEMEYLDANSAYYNVEAEGQAAARKALVNDGISSVVSKVIPEGWPVQFVEFIYDMSDASAEAEAHAQEVNDALSQIPRASGDQVVANHLGFQDGSVVSGGSGTGPKCEGVSFADEKHAETYIYAIQQYNSDTVTNPAELFTWGTYDYASPVWIGSGPDDPNYGKTWEELNPEIDPPTNFKLIDDLNSGDGYYEGWGFESMLEVSHV